MRFTPAAPEPSVLRGLSHPSQGYPSAFLPLGGRSSWSQHSPVPSSLGCWRANLPGHTPLAPLPHSRAGLSSPLDTQPSLPSGQSFSPAVPATCCPNGMCPLLSADGTTFSFNSVQLASCVLSYPSCQLPCGTGEMEQGAPSPCERPPGGAGNSDS